MVRRLRGNKNKFVAEAIRETKKRFARQRNEVATSDVSPWPPYCVFSSDNIYGACIG